MLQQSRSRNCAFALGRAYVDCETLTGRLLRVSRHCELEFGTKPNVLKNGILVCSPEIVTFLARHGDPVLASSYPSMNRNVGLFPDCRSGRVQLSSF